MKRFVGLFAWVGFSIVSGTACINSGVDTGASSAPGDDDDDDDGTPGPTGPEVIRFVALGDTGIGAEQQYPVAAAMAQKCAEDGCDFGMLLGDNFYNTGVSSPTDEQFSTKFEQPYGGLPFPFYVVLGNHDYGGDGTGYEFDKGMHQVTYAQTHPQFLLPAEYYSFEENPASFLALGTNLIFWNHDEAPTVQGDYFSGVLNGSTRPWKIAFGHHPYLSNGKHGNAGSYDGVSWMPVANGEHVKSFFDSQLCGKIDLYISGHDHSRQIIKGTGACDPVFVVSGAGAKTTEILGGNVAQFEKDTIGFTYFVVTDDTITIQMIDADGNLEIEYTMTH